MTGNERKQTRFADCYVLSNQRTKTFIHSFLKKFLPHRQEYTTTYQVPELEDIPHQTFYSADALITFLENNRHEPHAIYWSNKEESQLRGAMCIFMDDDTILFGLYCESLWPDTTIEKQYLQALMAFCGSTQGIILYEEPAPRRPSAFLERWQQQQP